MDTPEQYRAQVSDQQAGAAHQQRMRAVSGQERVPGIKQATTEDILAAHRVSSILLGFVPHNAGGLGSIIDAANAFHWNFIEPFQTKMLEVNDWLVEEVIAFHEYQRMMKNPNSREQAA